MQSKTVKDDATHILKQVVGAMQDKKAKSIVSIDLRKITDSVSQFFVVCHAPSTTQVDAIYDNVLEQVQMNCDLKPFHREGYENSEWILIDYFDVVVHVFREDIRTFYKLEELWADGVLKEYQSNE